MTIMMENEILRKAEEGGYAVGAFFPLSMDWIKPIFDAAEEEDSPIIITNTPELVEDSGIEAYSAAIMKAAQETQIPVAFHMDHGFTTDEKTLGTIIKFMINGWNSVMYDASMKPGDVNIRETREIVNLCHAGGVNVLGALGLVPRDVKKVEGYQVPKEMLTDPEEAKHFVKVTGVDSLAISVGQFVHPLIYGEPRPIQKIDYIDLDRLKRIRDKVEVPLVLHGGTHISDDTIRKTIEFGVSEVKVAALLAISWANELRKYLSENPEDSMTPYILKPALKAVKILTVNYMRLFGSSGKA